MSNNNCPHCGEFRPGCYPCSCLDSILTWAWGCNLGKQEVEERLGRPLTEKEVQYMDASYDKWDAEFNQWCEETTPALVCPVCDGQQADTCHVCDDCGFVSQEIYNHYHQGQEETYCK